MKNFLNFYMSEHSLTSITTIQLRETWEFFVEYKIPGLSGLKSTAFYPKWTGPLGFMLVVFPP